MINEKIIREFEEIFEDWSAMDLEPEQIVIDHIRFNDYTNQIEIYFQQCSDEEILKKRYELEKIWFKKIDELIKRYKLSKDDLKEINSRLWNE